MNLESKPIDHNVKNFVVLMIFCIGSGKKLRYVSLVPEVSSKLLRSEWTAVRCSDLDDMRTQNILFWQAQGGSAIRQAAWDIVLDYWKTHNLNPDELRLCRSTTFVRRS